MGYPISDLRLGSRVEADIEQYRDHCLIRRPRNCRLDLRADIWYVNQLTNRHVARESSRIVLVSRASPLNDQSRCGDDASPGSEGFGVESLGCTFLMPALGCHCA